MNPKEPVQTFALLVLEHTSSKYSLLALFLFNRVSVVVSVELTDLLCCSSYKVRFTQRCCSLEVATTLPRDWSGTGPRGQPWSLPHTASHFRLYGLRNTNWQLGLKGANLKGGEAGRLIPQLGEARWASGGWRDEWSANRDGLDAEGDEAVPSLQLHVKLNIPWIIDHIIYLIRRHTNAYFLLISWRHRASSFCASQSFSCSLSCCLSKIKQLSRKRFWKWKLIFDWLDWQKLILSV